MLKVFLSRFEKSDHGSLGVWSAPALGFSCFSMELPWRNNKSGLSCIPTGEYTVIVRWSRKYGYHFHITGVDGRTWILLHSGNFAGDVTKGFKTHSHGCILLGLKTGFLNGQRAVLNSRVAIRRFYKLMNGKPFKLIIR